MKRKSALVYLILVTMTFSVQPTYASVPKVRSIEKDGAGSDVIVTIEIEHTGWSTSHYVDIVEVTMNGRTMNFTDLEPQTTNRFSVNGTYNNTEIGDLQVRAHCVTHGWNQWEETHYRTMDGDPVPLNGSKKTAPWYPLVVPLTMMSLLVLMKWRKMIP